MSIMQIFLLRVHFAQLNVDWHNWTYFSIIVWLLECKWLRIFSEWTAIGVKRCFNCIQKLHLIVLQICCYWFYLFVRIATVSHDSTVKIWEREGTGNFRRLVVCPTFPLQLLVLCALCLLSICFLLWRNFQHLFLETHSLIGSTLYLWFKNVSLL